jgi:hypothetical protein
MMVTLKMLAKRVIGFFKSPSQMSSTFETMLENMGGGMYRFRTCRELRRIW